MTASVLTSSVLSFVLPINRDTTTPRHRRTSPSQGRVSERVHGKSTAMRLASTTAAGILASAPPPGAIGVRTLWAMLLGLFLMRLLWSLLTLALWS